MNAQKRKAKAWSSYVESFVSTHQSPREIPTFGIGTEHKKHFPSFSLSSPGRPEEGKKLRLCLCLGRSKFTPVPVIIKSILMDHEHCHYADCQTVVNKSSGGLGPWQTKSDYHRFSSDLILGLLLLGQLPSSHFCLD